MRRTAFELLSRLPRRVSAGGARWFVRGGRRRRAHAAISTLVRDNEVTVRRGHLAGLRLVATGSSAGYLLGSTEPVVQDALVEQLQPGKSFYDIGANVGFFTVLAARLVGRAGKVLAFEPLASNRAVLERNVALNRLENVMVLACAAAAASRPGWLSPRDGIAASLTDGGRPGDIPIEIVAIDDLVCAAALPAPDVVKLDVEGHEIDALRGMLWTLRRFALAGDRGDS